MSDPEALDPRGIIAEWYFGDIRRPDAEDLLIKKQFNVFLVRTSTTQPGSYLARDTSFDLIRAGAYAISLYNHSDRSMLHLLVNPTADGKSLIGERDCNRPKETGTESRTRRIRGSIRRLENSSFVVLYSNPSNQLEKEK